MYKLRMDKVSRTSATARVHTNEPCKVHYLISRRGTIPPPMYDIVRGRLPSTEAEVWAGSTWTDSLETLAYINFDNLTDYSYYTVWVGLEDMKGKISDTTTSVDFRTLRTYNNARFSITTTIAYDSTSLIKALSHVLALPEDLFTYLGYTRIIDYDSLGRDGGRRLQNAEESEEFNPWKKDTKYDFSMHMGRDMPYNTPLSYVLLLDEETRVDELKAKIPNLKLDGKISDDANEYSYLKPEFDSEILLIESGITSKFDISLNTEGTIYGVVLRDGHAAPDAYQVRHGFNGLNRLLSEDNRDSYSVGHG